MPAAMASRKDAAKRCAPSLSAAGSVGARHAAGRLRSASRIAVRTTPGQSTEADSGASMARRSLNKPSVMQTTACLDAKYGPEPLISPATDALLTMWPSSPPASMRGTKCWMP